MRDRPFQKWGADFLLGGRRLIFVVEIYFVEKSESCSQKVVVGD